MTNTSSPSIKAEIVSAPAISNMTVTPVGPNMFSLNLNLILVVRFPNSNEGQGQNELLGSTVVEQPAVSNITPSSTVELIYASGEKPEAGGETTAFQDFVKAHGYPPQSRAVLSEWVQNQQ